MPETENVILLCDSWYMKKPLVSIPEEYPNLDMIGNVRADSVLYDLPPERTGRKGRPAGHGKQLSIETDFLCLVGEGTLPEPDRKCMDKIYFSVLLWVTVEHRNQLL